MSEKGVVLGPYLTGRLSDELGLPYAKVEKAVYKVLHEISKDLDAGWLEFPDATISFSPRRKA